MWLDVCAENRDAIVDVLDELLGALGELRSVVLDGDPVGLEERLRAAQLARRSLPLGAPPAEQLSEVRVQIPDQPGELAAVTALATERAINVYDVEVAHSVDERGGRLLLVVDADRAASWSRHSVRGAGSRRPTSCERPTGGAAERPTRTRCSRCGQPGRGGAAPRLQEPDQPSAGLCRTRPR